MKEYERASSSTLPRRLPIIVRVDGRCFHSATRGLTKPFDPDLVEALNQTASEVCSNVTGAQLAYTQSDEVSFLIHGYKSIYSQPYFSNVTQKLVSVISSEFTAHFAEVKPPKMRGKRITFDARAFVVPENDVNNYFLWRQQDAQRNAVSMFARTLFSAKALQNVNQMRVKEMILEKTGKTYAESTPSWFRDGRVTLLSESKWVTQSAPSFRDDPNFINRLLLTQEELIQKVLQSPHQNPHQGSTLSSLFE